MSIRIDTADGVPIYLQIVEQIKRDVAAGRLHPEDPLPSVRQLALDLTINPNTVARAYLELEHQGVIYKRQGQGTFISAQALAASRLEQRKLVAGLFEKAVVEGLAAGLQPADLADIYAAVIRRYRTENS